MKTTRYREEESKWASSLWLKRDLISVRIWQTCLDQMCKKHAQEALQPGVKYSSGMNSSLDSVLNLLTECRKWEEVIQTIQTVSSVVQNTMRGRFPKENCFKTNLNFAPWPPATTWPPILHHYRWPGFKRCQRLKPATASPSHLVAVPLQLELAGVQPPRGANLWKTLRPLKNVTMVNETKREGKEGGRGRGKQMHYTARGLCQGKLPRC